MKRGLVQKIAVITTLALAQATAALAGTGAGGSGTMPWTAPLQTILNDITGPTGKILAGLAIAIGGAIWAFTRHEEGAKRFGQAIVGIGLILGAVNLVGALGFQGGLV
jgi:type IV secretory pathway VirB2 component (pilin)